MKKIGAVILLITSFIFISSVTQVNTGYTTGVFNLNPDIDVGSFVAQATPDYSFDKQIDGNCRDVNFYYCYDIYNNTNLNLFISDNGSTETETNITSLTNLEILSRIYKVNIGYSYRS